MQLIDTQLIAFMGLGPVELVVVGGVVLLLFGSRLPKVMRSLGQGIVEFKRGVQGIEEDNNSSSSHDADHAAGNG
ncbi:MAG: twin-arginine translocase TatA/TatE family subunit [Pirellulales bacterium]